jgi:penicillin-binding protein 2
VDKASSRLRVLALLVALMFVALTARLWFLQVLATTTFKNEARDNSVRFAYTEPLRGLILDDQGRPLVVNTSSLEVRVNRQELGDQAEAVVMRLAGLLDVDPAVLRERLATTRFYPFQPIPVAEFVSWKVESYIGEHPELFPGVDVQRVSVRDYPHSRLAAHLLGYVGLINADEYDRLQTKGYGQSDVVGRAGVEQEYEKYLRGNRGVQKFIVNSDGDTIRALAAIDPSAGDDLHLTLDTRLQRAAEQELHDGLMNARGLNDSSGHPLQANAGAVVVLDAKTGGIRAMASLPSFDPSWFVKGLTDDEAAYLSNDNVAPLVDRAVQLPYVPGSTFKPFTGLAAVKEGIASLNGSYQCTTDYVHPGDTSGTVFTNWGPSHAYMSLATALKVSCDTVFYKFGSQFYFDYVNNQLGTGETLQRDLRQWGFGSPTGVDLPSETAGLIPDAAYAEQNPKIFPDGWIPGGDIRMMIGSAYPEVSPLQLATAYAALGNGGHLCRPHLVDEIVAPNGKIVRRTDKGCDRMVPYTTTELDYVRSALATVTSGGTAACAFSGFPLSSVPVGGKTGTAERPPHQDTSWFAATVPANDPEYVVVTMVEQGGFGAQVAAPITRHVIDRIYNLQDPGTTCGTNFSRDQ